MIRGTGTRTTNEPTNTGGGNTGFNTQELINK